MRAARAEREARAQRKARAGALRKGEVRPVPEARAESES
jgi:hypothetical protein